jgi:hypothetical protein
MYNIEFGGTFGMTSIDSGEHEEQNMNPNASTRLLQPVLKQP